MKKTIKIIVWFIVVVIVFGAFVFYLKHKKPVVSYTTAEVSHGSLTQTVSVTGEINPDTTFDLAFKTSGTLNEMMAIGSEVSTGQEIANLDKSSLRLQLQQTQKDIEFQKKTLASMNRNTDTFNKDQRSAQEALVEKSLISQRLSQQNIKDASIFSPIDGIVTSNNFQKGELINAAAVAMTVVTKNLIINSKVPESDIVKLALGQHAKVTFDALTSDDVFDAEVVQIDPASTNIQNVVYYNIKLKFDSVDLRIKPGMSANIDIETAKKDSIIIAPLRAVENEDGKKFVNILQPDNTTKKVYVQTGLEGDDGMVEIKSGLNGGEKVVTFSQAK